MFGSVGATEIIIILFVLVLLFGAKKLPELAKGIGQGVKELKNSMKDDDNDDNKENEKINEKKNTD